MRAAPAVRASSRDTGPWLRLQQALYAAAAFVFLLWLGQLAGADRAWPPWVAAAAALAVAACSARMLAGPPSTLVWDCRSWSVGPGADDASRAPCESVAVMLDLGSWMLVRCRRVTDAGLRPRTVWLPLSRRDAEAAWLPLRVALHAHGGKAPGPWPVA